MQAARSAGKRICFTLSMRDVLFPTITTRGIAKILLSLSFGFQQCHEEEPRPIYFCLCEESCMHHLTLKLFKSTMYLIHADVIFSGHLQSFLIGRRQQRMWHWSAVQNTIISAQEQTESQNNPSSLRSTGGLRSHAVKWASYKWARHLRSQGLSLIKEERAYKLNCGQVYKVRRTYKGFHSTQAFWLYWRKRKIQVVLRYINLSLGQKICALTGQSKQTAYNTAF